MINKPDQSITDPKVLADVIEKHLQPGNEPGFPWQDWIFSQSEWDLILAKLRS